MLKVMKNVYKQKRQEGFTIIEVLIVLAIAALILLIVFLAVPALQRSSRNNGRSADAARISATVNSYVANHNGTPPAQADAAQILSDAGTLGQYPTIVSNTCTLTDNAQDFCIVTGAQGAFAGATSLNDLRVATSARCDGATPGAAVGGAPREMAVQYAFESSGGTITPQCLNI